MEDFLLAFDEKVCASYLLEPEKYELVMGEFEGKLQVTDDYARKAYDDDTLDDIISVEFGYRKLKDKGRVIIVLVHQFEGLPDAHKTRWLGFVCREDDWDPVDLNYKNWHRRYVQGDWSVENDALSHVQELMKAINALTEVVVGVPLFSSLFTTEVRFPTGENSHAYEDAHRELYRYLIDGIDKLCIKALGDKLSNPVNVNNDNTKTALCRLFPTIVSGTPLFDSLELISSKRRPASHKARQKVSAFGAHDAFAQDLILLNEGLEQLKSLLEQSTSLDAEKSQTYLRQMKGMPRIGEPAEPNFSISQVDKAVGKTIIKVEYGFLEKQSNIHQSELMIFYFDDGSQMAVATGSNAEEISLDNDEIQPEDFHAHFDLSWVDPM